MQTPGKLYIIATPLGNLGDISSRALETLKKVSIIAAEDTRHSGNLLQYFSITTPLISLYEQNEQVRMETILEKCRAGASVALISDAGTPLVSDPGYFLVKAAHQANITVVPIPGPCAAIAALSAAGLPSDRFVFEGFLPAKQQARITHLQSLVTETRTLIFYEAPHRILAALIDMITVFGSERPAALAKELTKVHEKNFQAPLCELLAWLEQDKQHQKGEFVLMVQGVTVDTITKTGEGERIVKLLLTEGFSVKQAVDLAVKITGERKNNL